MQVKRTLALFALVALSAAVTSTAATPRKFYWPEEKAERLAAAKVRIPYCAVFGYQDTKCAGSWYRPDGRPKLGFYGLNDVTCTGADERGETFAFARFRCRFVAGVRVRDYARGSLLLYPTGKTTLRWKLVAVARL